MSIKWMAQVSIILFYINYNLLILYRDLNYHLCLRANEPALGIALDHANQKTNKLFRTFDHLIAMFYINLVRQIVNFFFIT